MSRPASLNAAPKNHDRMGGVNKFHEQAKNAGETALAGRKVVGTYLSRIAVVAACTLALQSPASAQSTTGVIQGNGTGTGAIRSCEVGQPGESDIRPCISEQSINEAIDDRIQAAGGGTPGPNTVGSGQIVDGSVTGTDIADGSVTGTDIADGSVTGTDIADGSVTGTDIADGTVTGDDIQDGSVTGTDIADGSITQSDLASNSVGSAQIIDQSVTQADLADSSVGSAQIIDNSVTQADLANNSVGSAQIIDQSVTQADLSNNSVGSAQIIDNSVTQADLADNSVGSAQIIDNSVTSADIENGTIQNEDIAAGAVNSESIENDSILLEDLNGEVRQYINSGNSNTLTQANNYTDRRVNALQQQVNRNADIANDGVAMALAAQVPTLSEGTVQAVTIGYGYYSGSSAISIGGTTRIEDTDWQAFGTLGYGFKAEKFGLSVGLLWSR